MDGVLLLHAFPIDARMWEPQLAAFDASGVPVVAPHLPGFGGTALDGDVMTMEAAAGRCLSELDAAGVDRAVVCGLSMGGYVAFELWREARDRFVGLVLANTKAEADSPEAVTKRNELAERLLREGNVLVDNPPPLLAAGASEDLWERVRGMIADQPAASIAAAALGMAARTDSSGDLPGIDVPTLVITSDADALIPADVTAPMAERIPGAELAKIAGAGHLTNLEASEEFDRLLEAHLRRSGLG
ncbi:MAG TPA: alpha/beta fold hydrolase [Actinomycetota bacterium]|nr:alpha/beta fold hydrolase [Actinomycetota bacterium]